MAYGTNFDQTSAFSVASPPTVTVPKCNPKANCKEMAAIWGGVFTVVILFIVFLIFVSIDKAPIHAKISLQSLAVSSATWQSHFLVKNPSWRYSIYYNGDDADVRLGSRNVAVLNFTSERVSKDHTAFSLSFVAPEEGNRSDVVSEELKIKLVAKHKRYVDDDEAGFFNIRCQNVTRGGEKIICESSFTYFKLLLKRPRWGSSGGIILIN